jgi:CubicO group peptidase (beta-lactamase class C family)
MRENAVFRLASITKPLVSAAVLAIIERKKLSFEDPISRFLPDFRPKLASGVAPDLSIRQMLTHTSGLSYSFLEKDDGPYHKNLVSDGVDQPGLSLEEELRRIADSELKFPPGDNWGYSVSLDVLGAALERIEGDSLDDIVRRYVTHPLGLNSLSFALDQA